MLAEVEAGPRPGRRAWAAALQEPRSERALWAELRGVRQKLQQANGTADSLQVLPGREGLPLGPWPRTGAGPGRGGAWREAEGQRGQLWSTLHPGVGAPRTEPAASPEQPAPHQRSVPSAPTPSPRRAPSPSRGLSPIPRSPRVGPASVRGGTCASVSAPTMPPAHPSVPPQPPRLRPPHPHQGPGSPLSSELRGRSRSPLWWPSLPALETAGQRRPGLHEGRPEGPGTEAGEPSPGGVRGVARARRGAKGAARALSPGFGPSVCPLALAGLRVGEKHH